MPPVPRSHRLLVSMMVVLCAGLLSVAGPAQAVAGEMTYDDWLDGDCRSAVVADADVKNPTLAAKMRTAINQASSTQSSALAYKLDTLVRDAGFVPLRPPCRLAQPPAVVEKPVAVRGDGQITVDWLKPTDNGSEIKSYEVVVMPGSHATVVYGADATVGVVAGLTNGVAYTATVTASNDLGQSVASPSSDPRVPAGLPSAVARPSAQRGDHLAIVTWAAPYANGDAITGYALTTSPGGRSRYIAATGPLVATVRRLTNGHAYAFTIAAVNGVGVGGFSPASNSVTPAGKPGRVAKPTATVRGKKIALTWTAPTLNGSAITSYRIRCSNGVMKRVGGDTRRFVTSVLRPGQYTFTVAARNGVGTSAPSRGVMVRVPN